MASHGKLLTDLYYALAAVHSDTAVAPETTLSDLETFREHLDSLIDALNADIRAAERKDSDERE